MARWARWKAVTIAATLLASSPAFAATNYQDLWWNPNESGWGVNVVHQDNILFATWFIYQGAGPNAQPLWVVMPNAARSGAGGNVFTGDIYQTTGTPFSTLPFNPATVTVARAGSATFTFTDARNATLTYDIGGAQVTKAITRQTLTPVSLAGTYYGGISKVASGCLTPGLNGSSVTATIYSVAHTPATGALAITEVGGTSCRFTGTTQQYGSLLEASGSYTCAGDGSTGSFTAREGVAGDLVFGFKLSLRPSGDTCTVAANLGGFRQ